MTESHQVFVTSFFIQISVVVQDKTEKKTLKRLGPRIWSKPSILLDFMWVRYMGNVLVGKCVSG